MAESIYQYAAPPFAFGAIDDVEPFAFVIDTGVDALNLGGHEGLALLMAASPLDPSSIVSTPAPPWPLGDVESYAPLTFSWQGAAPTIYPAATIGRSSTPDDTPANTYVPAKLNGAINFGASLFGGADPLAPGGTGIGVLELLDPDGELDYMLGYNWDNAPIYLRRGATTANFADWPVVASLTGAGILAGPQKKEIRLRDQGWHLEQAELHGLRYGGTGGSDGDARLVGVVKPYCVGYVFNITPVQIGTTLLCYQVSCSSVAAITAVRDGGQALSVGSDYATYALLASATVAPGTYATCLAAGLFRLGSSPVYGITCDVTGDADVVLGQNGPTTRGQIARRIVTRIGAFRLDDTSQIDFPALAAFESRQPAPVGWFWDRAISKAEALDEIMRGCLGWWCMRLGGVFSLGQVEDPTLVSPTLILSFPAADVGERRVGEPQITDWLPPRRATYVSFRRNYTQQDQSQLAAAVSQADAAIYGAEERFSTAFDQWTANAYPNASVVYVGNSGYRDQADSDAEAARQGQLLKVPRCRYSVPVIMDPVADAVGRNTRVDNFNRLGFGAARQLLCCGTNATAGPFLQVDLWG